MVALKSSEADAFIARPEAARPVVLVFGPDAGLVRERAEAILRVSVEDMRDPFTLVRLDGETLAADPTRLIDEASTVPLFGGRRAISVRAGGRNIAAAVEPLLAVSLRDCRVVIEAGDLKRNAPLRAACERARNAVAIPCYPDYERDLVRLIDEEMRAAELTIAPDARAALVPLLGGDRRASLSEIRKLALYARGSGRVALADVLAVTADASALALDDTVDAAFAGRTADADTHFSKARAAGTAPGSIVSAALRQVAQLHRARLAIDGGNSIDGAVEGMRPGIHFRRRPLVEAALKAWTAPRLERAMAHLADIVLETRKQPSLADALARQSLLSIAQQARKSGA
jgi:DNA polymerase III subunit delta